MIRVLVVEDEPPILRSICKRITNCHNQFQIVGTAYNGKEAIDFLKLHHVDIVFTDISMPIMGGIELIKQISEQYSHISTVLISGFQEFEYAKSAIQYGVVDYLLKPLDNAQLSKLLDTLYLSYKEKQQINAMSLLYNNTAPESVSSEQPSSMCMFLLCIGSFSTAPLENDTQITDWWNTFNPEEILKTTLSEDTFYWVFPGKNINENIVILNNPTDAATEKALRALKRQASNCTFPVHIILSNELNSLSQIKQKYSTLKQLLRSFMRFSCTAVLLESELSYASPDIRTSDLNEKKLKIAFQKNDFELAKKLLLESFARFEDAQLTQLHLEANLRHILLLADREGFIKISIVDIENNLQILISNNVNYTDLSDNFLKLLWICHTENDSVATGNTHVLIEKIDHYIQKHLSEQINNQILSAHFGLTPSYMSRLFKDHKKQTPSEYVTTLRIQKAKELLISSPELLVKDIAQIVGYSDPLYFSRVFKKSVGIYPSEFQERNSL